MTPAQLETLKLAARWIEKAPSWDIGYSPMTTKTCMTCVQLRMLGFLRQTNNSRSFHAYSRTTAGLDALKQPTL